MLNIQIAPDCGNSPKIDFLKTWRIAIATNDKAVIENSIAENISWDIIGESTIIGKQNVLEKLEKINTIKMTSFIISQVVTHGKAGALLGKYTLENRDKFALSEFYQFKSAGSKTIKSITTFLIPII